MKREDAVDVICNKTGVGREIAKAAVAKLTDQQLALITNDSQVEQLNQFLNAAAVEKAPPQPATAPKETIPE